MEKDETSSLIISAGGSSNKRGKSVTSPSSIACSSSLIRGIPSASSVSDISAKIDSVFDCVIPYINDGYDRNSFSLVCRKWYELDSLTRKHVTVHVYYAPTPSRLLQRFPFLESLTLKGGSGCFMSKFRIDITPWIQQIAVSFICLKEVHLRYMTVCDFHIELLVRSRGKELRVLKITRCDGFSTDGLLHISKYCNDLKNLCLEANTIEVKDGKWLHDLALHSKCIESLNFNIKFPEFDVKNLTLLAKNCSQSLLSLNIGSIVDMIDMTDFFKYAVKLEEFARGKFGHKDEEYVDFHFPPNLQRIALNIMTKTSMRVILPVAHQLRELNLRYSSLNEDDLCVLVQRCPNLEVLYIICFEDRGLQVIGQFCKKLRKFKANWRVGDHWPLSQMGLIALAQGCPELECLHIEVIDMANEALECIGAHLNNLRDFRIIVHNEEGSITSLPLDNGVRALLIGCSKLERLDIRLWPGGLTDVGLGYIGKYGLNLRYLFLGYVGESDAGLVALSKGCPKLRKLEIRGCPFSEQALVSLMAIITSLRYMLDYGAKDGDFFVLNRPR